MSDASIVRHLVAFAEQMLRDFDKRVARGYLRRCLAHWSECYGSDVADDLERRIKALWARK